MTTPVIPDPNAMAMVPRVARPRPAITRDRYHRYTYQGVTYPGVTNIIRVLDKSDALMAWASRQTAEAALAQLDHLASLRDTVGPDGVVKALTARSAWKRDEAATLGGDVHGMAELIVTGADLPEMSDGVRSRAEAYAAWWQDSGWRKRITEAYLVDPTMGYGGTLDLLAFDEQGRTVLADVKTGNGVYGEARLQLAAYGMASLIAPSDSDRAWAMPPVERYVILHVSERDVRLVEVAIDDQDRDAFRACIPLRRWHDERKGKL